MSCVLANCTRRPSCESVGKPQISAAYNPRVGTVKGSVLKTGYDIPLYIVSPYVSSASIERK